MVSYCGQWLSVVRRPSSCVVRRPSCVVRRPSTFDVYTLETTFVTWVWWNLIRMFVLTISKPSSNMGYVGSKTRSPGQFLGNSCSNMGHVRPHLWPNFDETMSECLFWQYLSQVRIWVMSGQKLGHQVKSEEILVYTLGRKLKLSLFALYRPTRIYPADSKDFIGKKVLLFFLLVTTVHRITFYSISTGTIAGVLPGYT